MASIANRGVALLPDTPTRTFLVYPVLVVAWELFLNQGRLVVQPPYLVFMLWGYLQFRLCGGYRKRQGGGGPGLGRPPERLVTTGIYGWVRNPMYLGHLIFLVGLAWTLKSALAALIALATAIWFHLRVLGDEKRLAELFGSDYLEYKARVKRWIPGLF